MPCSFTKERSSVLHIISPVPRQWLLHQWQPSFQELFSVTVHQWMTQYYLHQSNNKGIHKGKLYSLFTLYVNHRECEVQSDAKNYTSYYVYWKKHHWKIHTVIPGKGATSEPVAISMFFVLITCVLPSSLVAVTWFFPVIFPNPDTCMTFSNQNIVNSDSNVLSKLSCI